MYDYCSPDPETNWPEEADKCVACGAYSDREACMVDCATRRLATQDDIEELDADSDLERYEQLKRAEVFNGTFEDFERLIPNGIFDCAGLELAEEWGC